MMLVAFTARVAVEAVINGTVLVIEYDCPANGSEVEIDLLRLVALAKLSVSVPVFGPVVTGTLQVRPESAVVGAPITAPVAAVPEREKLLAESPVVATPKTSDQLTVLAAVGEGLAMLRELMAVEGGVKLNWIIAELP